MADPLLRAIHQSAYGWCAGWRSPRGCLCETEKAEPCRRAVERAQEGIVAFLRALPSDLRKIPGGSTSGHAPSVQPWALMRAVESMGGKTDA